MRTLLLGPPKKRTATIAALAAALLPLAATTATAAPAPAPGCAVVRWGSLAKVDAGSSTGAVSGVRTGRHACFDRLVLDLDGDVDGWDVRYVDRVVQDGSGDPVAVRGGAVIQVVVRATATRRLTAPTAGFATFRHVAWAGSFEGQTTLGLGVRARLPVRVFELPGPAGGSRLVVDVAHRW